MNTFNVEWMNLDLGFAVTLPAELFPFKILKGEEGEEAPFFFPSPFPPPPLEPPSHPPRAPPQDCLPLV